MYLWTQLLVLLLRILYKKRLITIIRLKIIINIGNNIKIFSNEKVACAHQHVLKTCASLEVKLHEFKTFAVYGGERSVWRFAALQPEEGRVSTKFGPDRVTN